MKFRELLEAKIPEVEELLKTFKYGKLYATLTKLEDVDALKLKNGDDVAYIRKLYVKGFAYEIDWEKKGHKTSDEKVKSYKELIALLDEEFGFDVLNS